jgi:hypothetical protein
MPVGWRWPVHATRVRGGRRGVWSREATNSVSWETEEPQGTAPRRSGFSAVGYPMWDTARRAIAKTESLPEWVVQCASMNRDTMALLPALEDTSAGTVACPSIELKRVAPDYLDFLRTQLSLGARGPAWSDLLRRRLDILTPYEGRELLTVVFYRRPESVTIRIDPSNATVLHVEVS